MLRKAVSWTIIWVFGMTRPGIEPRSPGSLVNTLLIRPNVKRIEKKLDGNFSRILRAIMNKSWKQHPKKQQLYSHLPPTPENIQIRRKSGYCWRSIAELISNIFQLTPARPLTTNLTHYPSKTNKTCKTLLEKQGRTHKRRSSMYPFT